MVKPETASSVFALCGSTSMNCVPDIEDVDCLDCIRLIRSASDTSKDLQTALGVYRKIRDHRRKGNRAKLDEDMVKIWAQLKHLECRLARLEGYLRLPPHATEQWPLPSAPSPYRGSEIAPEFTDSPPEDEDDSREDQEDDNGWLPTQD